MELAQQSADRWMAGWPAGTAGRNLKKPEETDDHFQAGYVVGKEHRREAVNRVETHYGVKPRR